MTLAQLRAHCMSHAGVTEEIQWVDHLLFKVGGKMFCITAPDDPALPVSLKADPNEFDSLVEQQGVIPAPYMARNKWVRLDRSGVVPATELKRLVTRSYELVRDKLPKKAQAQLQASSPAKARARSKASLP